MRWLASKNGRLKAVSTDQMPSPRSWTLDRAVAGELSVKGFLQFVLCPRREPWEPVWYSGLA
jgi:hypothetical protein